MKKEDKSSGPKAKEESSTEKIARLEKEILKEAVAIALHQSFSCYVLIQKTHELLALKPELKPAPATPAKK